MVSDRPPVIGVVTGLRSEARVAERVGLRALACGADSGRAAACARRLADEGARLLVSFGVAGGLDPDLRAGDLVLADAVRDGDATIATEGSVVARLGALLPDAAIGTVLGVGSPIADPADKARLRAATGAIALDMESHALARVAAGRPFVVVRAIADTAGIALPPAARLAVGADGELAIGRVLGSILRRPSQIAGLIRLAIATRRALAALDRAARALATLG